MCINEKEEVVEEIKERSKNKRGSNIARVDYIYFHHRYIV
jgi:hypothetical protein